MFTVSMFPLLIVIYQVLIHCSVDKSGFQSITRSGYEPARSGFVVDCRKLFLEVNECLFSVIELSIADVVP